MNKPFDNQSLANTFGIGGALAGLAGVLIPVPTSVVLTQAFPGIYSVLWFLGLALSGIAVLAGSHLNKVEGPILVGVGLGVGGCFLVSYGVLLIVAAGLPALTAAIFILSLAGACFFRANRIRLLIKNVRTSLTKGG